MVEKKTRELTDEEKMITQKVMKGQQDELDHLKLMVEYNDFMLDKMLFSNYLEKRRAFVRQNKDFKGEIALIEANIKVSTKQLNEGVEIKDEKGIKSKKMVGVE